MWSKVVNKEKEEEHYIPVREIKKITKVLKIMQIDS